MGTLASPRVEDQLCLAAKRKRIHALDHARGKRAHAYEQNSISWSRMANAPCVPGEKKGRKTDVQTLYSMDTAAVSAAGDRRVLSGVAHAGYPRSGDKCTSTTSHHGTSWRNARLLLVPLINKTVYIRGSRSNSAYCCDALRTPILVQPTMESNQSFTSLALWCPIVDKAVTLASPSLLASWMSSCIAIARASPYCASATKS